MGGVTLEGMGARAALVGRDAEQQVLAAVIEAATAGDPGALLISGEAGVGKTRLVTEVTSGFERRGFRVLWGRCLRFGAAESALQPIGQLLTQWFRQSDDSERARVLQGLPMAGLASIAPILGERSGDDPGQLIPVIATVLERIATDSPTVVVLDDLQWADTTSLDLLAYVMAGFGPGQRLAVVGTYRDSDLHEGHRLHGWLADVRRFPLVAESALGPLDLPETEELVAALRGQEGVVARAAAVFERSQGNPYLTELLALAPEGDALGAGSLRDALLASWHRLGGAARQLGQLLAVGGRPVDQSVLEELGVAHQLPRETVRACVTEIVEAGIGTVMAAGRVWFRHPLISEALVSTLPSGELQEIHGEYARLWEGATGVPAAARAAHLALHHHGAQHDDEAFVWSLRAAAAAADLHAWSEEFEHLHRAARLWPRVTPSLRGPDADHSDMLGRASDSAIRAGEYHLALQLREEALRVVDRQARPLDAARLHNHLGVLRTKCGVYATVTVEPELLSLTEGFADSPERAIALARLAFVEQWAGEHVAAANHAAEALGIARRSGSDAALAWALGFHSQTLWGTAEGLGDAERAVAHARASGDRFLLSHTASLRANCHSSLGNYAGAADSTLEVIRELMATGSFYEAVQLMPHAGVHLLELGRWSEARGLLRDGLSRRVTTTDGADLRWVAAELAERTGDLAAAGEHLARAHELSPHQQLVGGLMVTVETRIALARGEPVHALCLMAEAMPEMVPVDVDGADELLLWSARAAADLAAEPGEHENAVAWLEKMVSMRGDTPPWFECGPPDDPLHVAWACLFAAETARCRDAGARRPELWADAVAASAAAGLPWEQALCSYRLAQALLATRGDRARAAVALRDAARIAGELGAAPILDDVANLAAQAHITLTEPATGDVTVGAQPVLNGLTRREGEVLQHLVAGRTYAEIARALFISEKTVSVHVSNLLRKTGTSSRIELADLARRLGVG